MPDDENLLNTMMFVYRPNNAYTEAAALYETAVKMNPQSEGLLKVCDYAH